MHDGVVDDEATATVEFRVTESDTAIALMSGDLPVLATPRLIAWLAAATCEAARPRLATGQSTVGTRVVVDHESPSAVGASVIAIARLSAVHERTLTFDVAASDVETGRSLAHGVVTRVVVDEQRFMARLTRDS